MTEGSILGGGGLFYKKPGLLKNIISILYYLPFLPSLSSSPHTWWVFGRGDRKKYAPPTSPFYCYLPCLFGLSYIRFSLLKRKTPRKGELRRGDKP